jgi:hypothetical protein
MTGAHGWSSARPRWSRPASSRPAWSSCRRASICYVGVAVAHQRCLQAMAATDRSLLLRSLAATPPSSSPETSRCRRQLLERRIATWDRTALQATRFEDELAEITDLVRLLAQRAACPDALIDGDRVEWRLAELDAEDAALHQLSAGDADVEADAASEAA